MNLQIIILAAGQGTRMYSNTPKVLHTLAGKSMLAHVIDTAKQLQPQHIYVVYGHGGEHIKAALPALDIQWVYQAEQLGTGHAVLQALPLISPESQVLILSADVPLIQAATLRSLIELQRTTPNSLALLTAQTDNPCGLGRICRTANHKIVAIVEEKDASAQEKAIKEVYSGICCANAQDLQRWLPNLSNCNAQNEYYLTAIIGCAVQDALCIQALTLDNPIEVQGVNNRLQLQELERYWQQQEARRLLEQGVMIVDAQRFDVRGELICGKDVIIDVNCVFIGKVILGDGCIIGPNCVLADVTLGAQCEVYSHSVLDNCLIENHCRIGPFARLRPGTQLSAECKIGNFVETKQASLGKGTKVNHLSYLGDITIGEHVTIGAGTITCNYDGVNKHQTVIKDGAFIGSDTQLIAPVTIGEHATIAAGSSIRRNAPAHELTLTESKQKTVHGWKRPTKKV